MIKINGKQYDGKDITIKDGLIEIDGTPAAVADKEINISVSGDAGRISVDSCKKIEVVGNCHAINLMNGGIEIKGGVSGDVKSTNGDVACGMVQGDVSTVNGDIKHTAPAQ